MAQDRRWKTNSRSNDQEIPCIYRSRGSITVLTKAHHCTLRLNTVRNFTSYSSKSNF